MNLDEWAQTMQQVAREREALNATYAEIQARVAADAEEARRTGVKKPEEELVPGLLKIVAQLGNFVNIEREHADKLYALLVDALRRLAEAYDIELPEDWPDVAGAARDA